jgi:hypothetical protein
MLSVVTGIIGLAAAMLIFFLIRRDHLHVRYGLWWIAVAVAFVVLGFYPRFFDWLAVQLGVAYGPVLALTLGLTVFVIKLLTLDIARSRNETRIVRLVQRISMLEAELDEARRSLGLPTAKRTRAGKARAADRKS